MPRTRKPAGFSQPVPVTTPPPGGHGGSCKLDGDIVRMLRMIAEWTGTTVAQVARPILLQPVTDMFQKAMKEANAYRVGAGGSTSQ